MKKIILMFSILIVILLLAGCSIKRGGIPNIIDETPVEMTEEEFRTSRGF